MPGEFPLIPLAGGCRRCHREDFHRNRDLRTGTAKPIGAIHTMPAVRTRCRVTLNSRNPKTIK